jgi:3-hydroxyisobutyrate dehydrogenase-like beta-hydroxyacid dehydrogenase
MRIVILHPGAMGSAVARVLVESGHQVGWLPIGRTAATRTRAEAAGMAACESAEGCEVVLSICPPAAAEETARSLAGFTGIYVDANAVSPQTAGAVRDIVVAQGARYVDGGIIGPPPTSPGTTRLYLSGAAAGDVATLFAGSRLEGRRLDGAELAASSLKMVYAAWTKISAALLLATSGAAETLGVDDALSDEWALSQPELARRLAEAAESATSKGWRWEDEMRQIAETFAIAGQPEGFGLAAAEVYSRFARPRGPGDVRPPAGR